MTNAKPYIVLASLELDATADNALKEAVRAARGGSRSELHLVHVVVTEAQTSAQQIVHVERQLGLAPQRIKERLDGLDLAEDVKVVAHLRVGVDPAHEILQAAVDLDADVIVVGTHRRRGLQKLLLGSVAERVLRDAHCTVLVALEKDYSHDARSTTIEPPCPDCLAVRKASSDAQYWCERHSRRYAPPHFYVPSDRGRNSLMPST